MNKKKDSNSAKKGNLNSDKENSIITKNHNIEMAMKLVCYLINYHICLDIFFFMKFLFICFHLIVFEFFLIGDG